MSNDRTWETTPSLSVNTGLGLKGSQKEYRNPFWRFCEDAFSGRKKEAHLHCRGSSLQLFFLGFDHFLPAANNVRVFLAKPYLGPPVVRVPLLK